MAALGVFSSTIKSDLESQYDLFDPADPLGSMHKVQKSYIDRKEQELNNMRFVKDGFEQQQVLDFAHVGKREAKKRGKAEKSKTSGADWFFMQRPEMTEEIKRDLEINKMRRAIFREHQYKRKATDKTPEYFQMGKVVEGAADFYSSRIVRKQQGTSMVDELLKDASFRRKAKARHSRIVAQGNEKKKEKAIRKKKMIRSKLQRKKLSSKNEFQNRQENEQKKNRMRGVLKHQKKIKKNK